MRITWLSVDRTTTGKSASEFVYFIYAMQAPFWRSCGGAAPYGCELNSNFQLLNIQLDCTYGSIVNQCIYKCGKLIAINLTVNITTEVPSNVAFIGALPACAVTFIACAGALRLDNGVIKDIYIGNATIAATNGSMPVGLYGINVIYITS